MHRPSPRAARADAAGCGPLRLAAIPVVVAAIGTAAAGGTAAIRVRSGETLSGIAAAHHTTVTELRRLNHLPPGSALILVGQRLLIPAAAPTTAPVAEQHPATTSAAARTQIETYLVRSGDNLTVIARHYRISVAAITARNHLPRSGLIQVGQRLQIAVPVPVKNSDNTFAGRTYPAAVVASAHRHRAILAHRDQPSPAVARAMIVRTAQAWGVDVNLALAIAWQESGFQQRIVSPADAIGVMQVVPSTCDYISQYVAHRRLDLLDPADNITAGVALLHALTRAAPLDQAIAGYYQGLGSVLSKGMYADTLAYVANVLSLRRQFAR
jgi:N-acetylmuramoyl-L-alanine amidase